MLKYSYFSAKQYHKRDIHGHKLMIVDLCLINISAAEQISFTDQPHTWKRKGVSMKNQLLMNVKLDTLLEWSVSGGMKVVIWSFFMPSTNWGDTMFYGCDILCSLIISHSYICLSVYIVQIYEKINKHFLGVGICELISYDWHK